MKRLITTICAVFIFCFVLSGTAVQAAAEYQGTLSKDYRMSWSNGTNKVYYATYPEGGTHMNKMNVYRCDRNGKNNKLLFTQIVTVRRETCEQ